MRNYSTEEIKFLLSVPDVLLVLVFMNIIGGRLRYRGMQVVRRFFHSMETNFYKKVPDPWDVATGIERWEAVQYAKGNTNPFFTNPMKRGPGTKDCPNVVFSVYDKRIVGCLCHDDNHHIVWWWLHEGFPRRCECNYWFVLERVEMPKIYEDED